MSSNIEVKLDVLNQKASPALYAAPLADRPAASFTGRLFVDSDSPSTGLYRDTGSSWIQIADAGAGTSGTLQQVTTNGNTTSIGISVTTNGIGIGTTIPATNRLDIHAASGIQATFNGTGTTNSALQLQSAGVGKWNVTNKYNSAANDFAITDVLNTIDRLTIKNTGQTFIGADTTSSGLLVVNSASSDSHIVVLGANSPSIRIRDSGSSLVQNVGLGISTTTNAFIQGSASGNYCIFNSSTTASPILFGIYDSGTSNTQEAARISASRNFLINTTTDSGQKLQVNGSVKATNYFLDSMTAGNGVLYYSGTKVTLANYNSNGTMEFEVNGGSTALTIQSTLNCFFSGFIGVNNNNPTFGIDIITSGTGAIQPAKFTSLSTSLYTVYRANGIDVGYIGNGTGVVSGGSATDFGLNSINNLVFSVTGAALAMTIKSTGIINLSNVPTSAAGLVSGDIYRLGTVLNIVP